MIDPGAECPECGQRLGSATVCKACGWTATVTAASREPVLPAYRECPDRRSRFQPCEHVAVGAERACPECEEQIREYRRQFREHGRRIQARNVQL